MDVLSLLFTRLMSPDTLPSVIGFMVAAAILLLGIVAARAVTSREDLKRRISTSPLSGSAGSYAAEMPGGQRQRAAEAMLRKASRIVTPTGREELTEIRKALINAGFFSPSAVPLYFGIRIGAALGLPLLAALIGSFIPQLPSSGIMLAAAALSALGLVLPPILLDVRRSSMQQHYRNIFPDFMDILVVCVESGQSLQGSIERVGGEIMRSSTAFGANLQIVSLELRAGRDLQTALSGLAARLGIDEVKSLTLLLKQSEELGTSLAGTLRVYSDEMRDKRLMRAEAKANALPVKMVLPLGVFMFPVILVVIMLPLVVRIKGAFV